MLPTPAQYLLRFDDLCPTFSRNRWLRFLPLIEDFGLRPILAVVPDNRDRDLEHSLPDPVFWSQMRALEAAGATVALHGYRHLCLNHGKSLLPLYRHTEFAGVTEEIQRLWIRSGLDILRAYGLNPKIWVAPRHGFDRLTLGVLRQEGITLLSDGFARVPYLREGLTWIPQQLWEPAEKSKGIWTICVHCNTAQSADVDRLHRFLCRHAAQFTSVDQMLTECRPSKLALSEQLYAGLALACMQSRGAIKRWLQPARRSFNN